jgi:hypothetical protein
MFNFICDVPCKVKDGADSFKTCAQDMVSGYELAVALDRVEIVKVYIL